MDLIHLAHDRDQCVIMRTQYKTSSSKWERNFSAIWGTSNSWRGTVPQVSKSLV